MSRIGRMPITVPAGVTVTVGANNEVTVKGPLGTLSQTFNSRMTIAQEGDVITITRPTDEKEDRSAHGLTRALLQNMVTGVSQGYSKTLEIIGVGYKAAKVGKTVQLYLGHSLMAGAVFVEYVFDWKGMGIVIVDGLEKYDFPVVMGAILFICVILVVINILVDILYGILDPRVRLE